MSDGAARWRLNPVSYFVRHRAATSTLLACVALTAPAAAAELPQWTPPVTSQVPAPAPGAIRDRVITGDARAASLRSLARAANTYETADGHSVSVEVSDGYASNPARDQALVNYLGTLLHGNELSKLNVYVATALEIPSICGGLAAACYFPDQDTMVIVGELSFGGLPTSFVAAHEYGHHVENHRSNSPWPSLGWGTKRWSTYERVCPRYLAGTIYPGERYDEYPGSFENFYWQNPGEAFAEAYAKYHSVFRNLLWEWIPSLEPDAGAFSRIRQDVESPWAQNRTSSYAFNLRRGERVRKWFPVPLDGKLIIKLRGPKGTDFDLKLLDPKKRVIGKSAGRGSREKIRSFSCGDGRLAFEAIGAAGRGKAKVTVSKA